MTDSNGTNVAGAIVVAGALIALAIYARPVTPAVTPPRYSLAVTDQNTVRLDTTTGEIVECSGAVCAQLRTAPDELFIVEPPK